MTDLVLDQVLQNCSDYPMPVLHELLSKHVELAREIIEAIPVPIACEELSLWNLHHGAYWP